MPLASILPCVDWVHPCTLPLTPPCAPSSSCQWSPWLNVYVWFVCDALVLWSAMLAMLESCGPCTCAVVSPPLTPEWALWSSMHGHAEARQGGRRSAVWARTRSTWCRSPGAKSLCPSQTAASSRNSSPLSLYPRTIISYDQENYQVWGLRKLRVRNRKSFLSINRGLRVCLNSLEECWGIVCHRF